MCGACGGGIFGVGVWYQWGLWFWGARWSSELLVWRPTKLSKFQHHTVLLSGGGRGCVPASQGPLRSLAKIPS
jgi:hypothetical protein